MRVYFSSPYEHDRANTNWKIKAAKLFHEYDIDIVDPCPDDCDETHTIDAMKEKGDWLGVYEFCSNIVEGDLAMLNRSQGMLAYLPYGAVTFGTTHEIIHALNHNIPIVLVMPEGIDKVSHWLWGLLGPNRIFDNVEAAAGALAKRVLVAEGTMTNG